MNVKKCNKIVYDAISPKIVDTLTRIRQIDLEVQCKKNS